MCSPFPRPSELSLSPSLPLFPPSLSQTLRRTHHGLGMVLGSWKTAGNKVLALREFTTQVVRTVVSSSNSNNNNSNKYKISCDRTFPCFLFYAHQQSIFLTLIPHPGGELYSGLENHKHFIEAPAVPLSGGLCWREADTAADKAAGSRCGAGSQKLNRSFGRRCVRLGKGSSSGQLLGVRGKFTCQGSLPSNPIHAASKPRSSRH